MSYVIANTITPVIAANHIYLFILNALIAMIEAYLLRRWFGGGRRALLWMLAGNYLAAWGGWIALNAIMALRIEAFLGPRPIERINLLAGIFVLLAFALSVVIEIGFVHSAIERTKRSARRALGATLCINAASYLLISFWFLTRSYTLPLNARVTNLAEIELLPAGTLYWVNPAGEVLARNLREDESPRRVSHVMNNDFIWPYQLRISRNDKDVQRVRIDAMYGSTTYADHPTPPNLEAPAPLVLDDAGSVDAFPPDFWKQGPMLRKETFDLRPPDRRQMQVKFDWYRHHLRANAHLCVGFGMIDWRMQEPTILPDGKIVFEWEEQIVLFDPKTQKLAFVAAGTCPAFVPSVPAR